MAFRIHLTSNPRFKDKCIFRLAEQECCDMWEGSGMGVCPREEVGFPFPNLSMPHLDAALCLLLRLWDTWCHLLPGSGGSWAPNRTEMLDRQQVGLPLPRNPVSPYFVFVCPVLCLSPPALFLSGPEMVDQTELLKNSFQMSHLALYRP